MDQKRTWIVVVVWLLLPWLYLRLPFHYQSPILPLPEPAPRWVYTGQQGDQICERDESRPRRPWLICAPVRDWRLPLTANISKVRAELVAREVVVQHEAGLVSDFNDVLGQPCLNFGTEPTLVELSLPNGQKRRAWERSLLTETRGISGRIATVYVDAETDEPLVLIKNQWVGDLTFDFPSTLPLCDDPLAALRRLYTLQRRCPVTLSLHVLWVLGGIVGSLSRLRTRKRLAWLQTAIVGVAVASVTVVIVLMFLPCFTSSLSIFVLLLWPFLEL
jgi:hypothetical protein